MAGKGTPPGIALYPECSRPGTGGMDKHRKAGTVPCRHCRAENAARSARYRRERYLTGPLKVPALGSQRRIRALMRIGWTQKRLEECWGLAPKTIGPLKVPALGSQRRIRALMRIGWTQKRLEECWGLAPKTIGQLMLRDTVTRAKADRVAKGYRALAFAGAGPDDRIRRWAERRGWPGPLDWDDIDSRDEVPACEIERAHAEALAIQRDFRKMLAKREKRARMTAEERRAEQARERDRKRQRQEGTAA
jgi:hypothetical protein